LIFADRIAKRVGAGGSVGLIRFSICAVWFLLAIGPAAACASAPPELVQAMLAAHNAYRREVGVGPIAWSADLAYGAQQWAEHLMAMGGMTMQHSSPAERQGAGENLWAGTGKRFAPQEMVDDWGSEKRDYRGEPVTLDNLARVGHYTQMVWRGTTLLGCALALGQNSEVPVCRYSPPGNFLGRRPY
jgi:hypothetical protein